MSRWGGLKTVAGRRGLCRVCLSEYSMFRSTMQKKKKPFQTFRTLKQMLLEFIQVVSYNISFQSIRVYLIHFNIVFRLIHAWSGCQTAFDNTGVSDKWGCCIPSVQRLRKAHTQLPDTKCKCLCCLWAPATFSCSQQRRTCSLLGKEEREGQRGG